MPIIDRPLELEDVKFFVPLVIITLAAALVWCRTTTPGGRR